MQVRFIESSDTFWPETPTASPSNESKSEIQINERIFKNIFGKVKKLSKFGQCEKILLSAFG